MVNAFLIRAVKFFLIFISIYFILSIIIKPDSYQMERRQLKQLEEKKHTIKAITLGHSHNLAIDFKYLEINGYHLWLKLEDIFESYNKLQVYVQDLEQLEMVFLPISYFLFGDNKYSSEYARKRFYSLYPTSFLTNDFYNFFGSKFFLLNKIWVKRTKSLNNVQLDIDGIIAPLTYFRKLSRDSLIILTDLESEFHKGYIEDTRAKNRHCERDAINTLTKFIELAKEKNIRLILYTPPYFKCYNELFNEVEKLKIKKMMTSLTETYNLEYYDFSDIDSLSNDPILFYDDDHLNLSVGAPKFSKLLRIAMKSREDQSN